MIIDAHHHLWDPDRRDYPWLAGDVLTPIRRRYDVARLRAHAKQSGVDGTVLVQTVPTVEETEEFLALADDNRDLIRGVVGWVDLTDPAVGATLAGLRAGKGGDALVGVRHQAQDEADPDWLARPEVLAGLRAVAEAGLTYDLLVLPHQLRSAVTAATEVPEGRYVLDHAGKPPIASGDREPWAGLLRELAALPNVACKLSGLVTEADWTQWTVEDIRPYAAEVLAAFGPSRVLFGSDWPVCELASTYPAVTGLARELCAERSEADRAAVFGGNALDWYRLA
ncbi:MAG TPA: amidohydrolase family protein [Pseudonocardiaceae bacterium]|jgi:L-fuconolactonase|nr:amidohydrolase family protein [Pseudonocardiaceae bacterium]